ncbi:MAG: hypothetical protein ACRCT8_05510 [Lacipirellulaceae bacterium]
MNGQLRAIVWKEWREHLPIAGLILGATALAAVVNWIVPAGADPTAVYALTFLYATPVVAVAMGARLASAERSEGTHTFVQSMPMPLKRFAAIKLGFAVATVFMMIAGFLCLVVLSVWLESVINGTPFRIGFRAIALAMDGGATPNGALLVLITIAAVGTSFVLWVAGLAVNSIDVGRAVVIGLGAWIAGLCVYAFAPVLVGIRYDDAPVLFDCVASAIPGGLLDLLQVKPARTPWCIPIAMTTAVVVHVLLAARFVGRFGSADATAAWSPQPAQDTRRQWLGPPARSRWRALLWKHARAGAPAVIGAFVFACGTSALMWIDIARSQDYEGTFLWMNVSHPVVSLFVVVGAVAAVLVGLGIPTTDLGKGVVDFLRSRPIEIGAWYWTCAALGSLSLIVAFGLPAIAQRIIDWMLGITYAERELMNQFWIVTSLLPIVFSSATLAGCLMRRADLAALTSLVFVLATGWAAWLTASVLVSAASEAHSVVVGVLWLALAAGMLLLGWLAVRIDWSIERLG